MKTILLENDDWFWNGLEDFCKSFDPEFQKLSTYARDWMIEDDYKAAGFLSQPFIKRLVVASSFEGVVYTSLKEDVYPQVEHWLKIIWASYRLRDKLGYTPLEIVINYHGDDFAEDVLSDTWGDDFKRSIQTFIRQEPELKVLVYKEYKLQYDLRDKLKL